MPGQQLDVHAIARFFESRTRLPDDLDLPDVYGRFLRGTDEKTLSILSDEPGKKLSWVFGPETLPRIVGNSAAQAMLSLGFSKTWLLNRLRDGTRHRLVLMQSPADCVLATWDSILRLIQIKYGDAVWGRVAPFISALKNTAFDEIDVAGRLRQVAELPVHQKIVHPDFYSADKFLAIEEVTLYDVRGFFYHSIGCNYLFQGTGYALDGDSGERTPEYLMPNSLLCDIPNSVLLNLDVTLEDINMLS
ncbi:hypothetical protein HDU80_000444 [Chytriomyces hyalinus]|nr:hypothetical protein HDU80_000444 [Chytriomyces hyalinus]